MGNGVIALMVAAGFSAWMYSKVMRSTGGNLKTTAIATAFSGLIVFVVTLTLIGRILPK